ncbi:hypothetical protein ACEPAF_738 [Sanghuangporus sanghuang]
MTSHETSESTNVPPWNKGDAQIVLVLVGLIASGKSTFAKALEEHFPEFRRCNQDDLGDRKTVEQLVRISLKQGFSVCIDRTNFDETQRLHWIRIAREFPRTRLWCIIFDTPIHICRERLQSRTNHPTIRSPEQGIEVLCRFKNMFIPPSAGEGFECIFTIKPEDHSSANYSRDEIQTLLERVATSPPPKPSIQQRGLREYFEAVSPRVVGKRSGGRNHDFNRRPSGNVPNFRRYTGENGPNTRQFHSTQSTSSEAWQGGSVSARTEWRRTHVEARNVFQDDGHIEQAAEQELHTGLQQPHDRTMPSKQAADGTAENPILLD